MDVPGKNGSRPHRVALIGECMIELHHVSSDRLALGYSGDAFNTAAYLARSAEGGPGRPVEVQFVSVVGDDPYSAAMRRRWRAHGVGDAYTRELPGGRSGLYLIRTDDQGERTFHYYRSESAARTMFGPGQPADLDDAIAGHDLVYVSGITLSILAGPARRRLVDVLAETRRRGGRVAFDSNYRPAGWPSAAAAREAMSAVLAHADIALPTLADDRQVFGDAAAEDSVRRLRAAGAAEIAVKLGAEGCLIADRETMERVPAVPGADVIDTTAAGDSFNGAYLAARLADADRRAAAEAACRMAAQVIAHPGALLPSR